MNDASILLLSMLAVGGVLWIAGHRMLRWATVLVGIVCGALMVNAAMASVTGSLMILLWILAGALLGAALSWLLFRLIAGTSMAITLALVAMLSYCVWQQLPMPQAAMPASRQAPGSFDRGEAELWQYPAPGPAPATDDAPPRQPQAAMVFSEGGAPDAMSDADDMAEDPIRRGGYSESPAVPLAQSATRTTKHDEAGHGSWHEQMQIAADSLSDDVASRVRRHAAFGEQVSQKLLAFYEGITVHASYHGAGLRQWWQQLTPVDHLALIAAALVASIVGFVLGLSMPYMAAAGQSAMLGTMLLSISYVGFATASAKRWNLPIPQEPQQWLLILILGTAGGLLIQWWIWAPRDTSSKADAKA